MSKIFAILPVTGVICLMLAMQAHLRNKAEPAKAVGFRAQQPILFAILGIACLAYFALNASRVFAPQ